MALGINSFIECRATGTAANLNGGGFNPERTATLTDLAATSSSGQSATATVSSATYTFVASDVNAYLFIQSGGTFKFGWYKITSVAAGVATLASATGEGIIYTSGAASSIALDTSNGIATTTTPTGGSFMIDYSQQNGAIINGSTDFTSVGSSTTLTSVTGGFTAAMVGNYFHQTTTGTGAFGVVGWYEITAVASGTSLTLDRTSNSGTASVACTGYIGGAMSLSNGSGATDDAVFELGSGTNGSGAFRYFIKNGTYATMAAINIAASGGSQAPVKIIGYNTNRVDGITSNLGSNRPTLNFGANAFTQGPLSEWWNVMFTGTPTTLFTTGANTKNIWCKYMQTSTTTGRAAMNVPNGTDADMDGLELISLRGNGLIIGGATANIQIFGGAYIHNCVNGFTGALTTGKFNMLDSIVADNITTALNFSGGLSSHPLLINNTFYGAENKLGTAMVFATGSIRGTFTMNNIFYGFVTPINFTDVQTVSISDYNDYFNNTNANTNYPLGKNDLAVNPTFTNVVQRTGATATTTSGNHLVQSGALFQTWGITAGVDILTLISGTGTTNSIHYSILSVDSETQITVGETLTANATTDHVWQITQGHNFAVGTNLKAKGAPGVFSGGLTTGYMDIGAAQRQESGGATSYTFGG